jgi:hypothetical protein
VPILITTDAGQVKVGETVLPGVFESMEISGSVKTDEVEIAGKEEKVTQAVSFENARIRLTAALVPDEEGGDCTDQIAAYQKVFRKSPDQEKPGVYQFVNRHAQARNISEVIFTSLQTSEDNKSDKILVICEFIEHVPIQVTVATQVSTQKDEKATSGSSGSTTRSTGMGNLRLAEIEDKTLETPAVDKRESSLGSRILAWLKGENDV